MWFETRKPAESLVPKANREPVLERLANNPVSLALVHGLLPAFEWLRELARVLDEKAETCKTEQEAEDFKHVLTWINLLLLFVGTSHNGVTNSLLEEQVADLVRVAVRSMSTLLMVVGIDRRLRRRQHQDTEAMIGRHACCRVLECPYLRRLP